MTTERRKEEETKEKAKNRNESKTPCTKHVESGQKLMEKEKMENREVGSSEVKIIGGHVTVLYGFDGTKQYVGR
jgi:hypothetical protein